MKKKLFNGLLLAGATLFLAGCSNLFMSAVDYNNKIVDIDMEIVNAEDAVDAAWNSGNTRSNLEAYKGLTTALDNAEKNMVALGDYKGDKSFYDVVIKYIADKKAIHEGDEKTLYDLMDKYENSEEEPTQAQIDEFNDLDAKVQEAYDKIDEEFIVAQEAFAAKHNFELEDQPTADVGTSDSTGTE